MLPFLLFFFLPLQRSIAQSPNSLFDLSKVILQLKVTASDKDVRLVKIPPVTTIVVKPGTFDKDVIIFVYQGDFDKVKAALPLDQSPVSSYFFVIKTIDGSIVTPSIPLNVQSYNNYSNTNTFYYPVDSSQKLDDLNKTSWTGNVLAKADLPITDSGFIIAANKDLAKDDPALSTGTIANNNPSVAPSSNALKENSFISQNLYLILALVAILVSIVGIAFLLLKSSKKTNI